MIIGFNYATRLQDQNMDSLKEKQKTEFPPPFFFSFQGFYFPIFLVLQICNTKNGLEKKKTFFGLVKNEVYYYYYFQGVQFWGALWWVFRVLK